MLCQIMNRVSYLSVDSNVESSQELLLLYMYLFMFFGGGLLASQRFGGRHPKSEDK